MSKQVLDQMIFQRALEFEADRLGMRVTPEEQTERIKELLPTAWSGSTWLKDRYPTKSRRVRHDRRAVRKPAEGRNARRKIPRDGHRRHHRHPAGNRAGIPLAQRKGQDRLRPDQARGPRRFDSSERRRSLRLVREKLRRAIRCPSAAPRATPCSISPSSAPPRRSATTACAPITTSTSTSTKSKTAPTSSTSLFKTIGKTDAEVAEIRQKAEDVLKQAKHGANFEDLAKKYSEDDATKPKGGDLGWIVDGQTVPEFQQAAFSLPKGSISDLVKTQYGFHIIKVLDRETAHTKTFEEVRDSILQPVLDQKVSAEANDISNQMAAAVRQSDRQSLDDLAKKFHLDVGETLRRSPSPIRSCRSAIRPSCIRSSSSFIPASSASPSRSTAAS